MKKKKRVLEKTMNDDDDDVKERETVKRGTRKYQVLRDTRR